MHSTFPITVLLLILMVTACIIGCAGPQTQPAQQPTAAAIASKPASTVPETAPAQPKVTISNKILFKDDFSSPDSGWATFNDDFGEGKYQDGSYILQSRKQEAYAVTSNAKLPSAPSFILNINTTMLEGRGDDSFVVVIGWPDVNPMRMEGVTQPSYFEFFISPVIGTSKAFSYTPMKDLSSNRFCNNCREPGYLLRNRNYTCVNGLGASNNLKLYFNPDVRFLVNDIELINTTTDRSFDYINRLVQEKTIAGANIYLGTAVGEGNQSTKFRLEKFALYQH